MEDWLYAAGWDGISGSAGTKSTLGLLHDCAKSGSTKEQQLLSQRPENRALVFLAETSDLKQPPADALGGSYKVLQSLS